jgi:hypothetical protein
MLSGPPILDQRPSPAAPAAAPSTSAAAAKAGGGGGGASRASKRKKVYEAHRTAAEITAGVAAGRLHQGALRVNRWAAGAL